MSDSYRMKFGSGNEDDGDPDRWGPQTVLRRSHVYQNEDGSPAYEAQCGRNPGNPKNIWRSRRERQITHEEWERAKLDRKEPSRYVYNLDGVRRVLYRLPTLLRRPEDTLYIPEGEKDADTLAAWGLVATTAFGGAGKWLKKYNYDQWTKERPKVVVLKDNDWSGLVHADQVWRAVAASGAKEVRTLMLPGLPPKGDVSDWKMAGGTLAEFLELVEKRSIRVGGGW